MAAGLVGVDSLDDVAAAGESETAGWAIVVGWGAQDEAPGFAEEGCAAAAGSGEEVEVGVWTPDGVLGYGFGETGLGEPC